MRRTSLHRSRLSRYSSRALLTACAVCSLVTQMLAAPSVEEKRTVRRLVDHALQYEADGQTSSKQTLLDEALKQLPDFAPARWQSGFVKVDNRWMKVEDVPQPAAKSAVATYRQIRDGYPRNVAGQLELARWCAKKKLVDQQRAHLTKVLELDADNAEARAELGFKQIDGAWHSREDQEQAAAQEKQLAASLKKWSAKVDRIAAGFSRKDSKLRERAASALLEIKDPAAIAAIEQKLSQVNQEAAQAMVDTLARMPASEAALALARQAVGSPWQEIRESAVERLRSRPLESFVPALLAALYSPIQDEMSLVLSPDGRLFYSHDFKREGHEQKQEQVVQLEVDRIVLPGATGFESLMDALMGVGQLAADREQRLEAQNRLTEQVNERVCWVLSLALDTQVTSPKSAWDWWTQRNEVFYPDPKPTARTYQSDTVTLVELPPPPEGMDCLAAGTQVWTDLGTVAIEKIKVGDRVLAQHADTGELAFKPVLRTTVRPKSELVHLEADGASFNASGGHPFWVSGRGWLKARELEPGMSLHGVTTTAAVRSLGSGPSDVTYNLIVADFHTYFVGSSKLLSHDNTVRRPAVAGVPGLSK